MRHLCAALLLAVPFIGSAVAQEKPWVGKIIFVKKSGIKIGHTSEDGKQVYVATLDRMHYLVIADKDGWIKVADGRGSEGWFDKDDAVLLDDAVVFFTERIRQNPMSSGAYHRRGEAWRLKGEPDNANKDFGEALRLKPRAAHYNNRGIVWHDRKEFDKAMADYNEAIKLDPKFYFAYSNRAWLWATCPDAKYRDGKKALESAKKALELSPREAHTMDTLAAAYAEVGDFVEAVRWEERTLEDPRYRYDDGARRRLELYKKKQPYRQE